MDWTAEELVSMDRKTRKILAVNGCLHTRSNVAKMYRQRKEGEGGCLILSSVSRRRAKPVWLPEKKHRVGANGFEGKGVC